jgi:demethylspheroidene O-methyltransferase
VSGGVATPTPSWLETLRNWLDRRVADPAFRRWAAAFPLTRPIARRRARELFDLVAGFTYSQVLFACVRLDLFEQLAGQSMPVGELAARMDMSPAAATRLLDAGVALRLFSRRLTAGHEPMYSLGVLGAPMVGNAALTAMVEHHAVLYADLADPVGLLRAPAGQSALARYWPYAGAAHERALSQVEVDPYSALMAASMPLVADEVLDAYSLARHRCLLDVGGGEGAFAAAAARRWPHLKLAVFDLPAVAQRARRQVAARGLADRIDVHEGSFLTDALPHGADVISLVRVVHDHDDDHVLVLLNAVRKALPPHGVLLLAEPMADTPGAQAMGDAYFGLYLWAMGSGKPRSADRLGDLLVQAGFGRPRSLRNLMPLQTRVLLVRPATVANRVDPE